MMKMRFIHGQMVLIIALLFFGGVLPLSAQTKLPKLELIVNVVEGRAEYRPDTGEEWFPLQQDQILKEGDHVRTGDESTVQLEVPGISFLKVTPGTEMQLENLNRKKEQRGLLTTEELTVNEINIETVEGKVQNRVRKHEGVATEYDLTTPNAVAGIRGTSFQCDVSPFGRTECGVLDGEVRFASRANPRAAVAIQPGQKSAMAPDATEPEEPEELNEEEIQELSKMKEESKSALQLPPFIEELQLNETGFQETIRILYEASSQLTLSGQAGPAEEGADLESVSVSIGGSAQSVDGTAEWSVSHTPEVPEEGTERSIEIEVTATDSNDRTATRTVTLTLVNPEETGTREIPPENYEDGNVSVEFASVAGLPTGEMEFPYHAYKGDVTGDGIEVAGLASGDATIEGVAYSLDGGQTWSLATGSENWYFHIPATSAGEYNVEVIAWTVDGIIGEPVEIGPIHFEPISFTSAMRQAFDAQWEAFEREDVRGFESFLSPDFLFDDGQIQQLDKNEFRRFIDDELFDIATNLRSFYNISNIQSSPFGGEITSDIEWEGNLSAEDMFGNNTMLPFITKGEGVFKYQRELNGEFKQLSFEDFQLNFYRYRDREFVLDGDFDDDQDGERDGMDVLSVEVKDNGNIENNTLSPHEGHLIFSANFGGGWDGDNIYVNNNTVPFCLPMPSWWPPVSAGGVKKLAASDFSDVQSIPAVGSGEYSDTAPIQQNSMYAFNVKVMSTGEHVTGVFKILSVTGPNSFGRFDRLELRMVTTEPNEQQSEILTFGGIDPFN